MADVDNKMTEEVKARRANAIEALVGALDDVAQIHAHHFCGGLLGEQSYDAAVLVILCGANNCVKEIESIEGLTRLLNGGARS